MSATATIDERVREIKRAEKQAAREARRQQEREYRERAKKEIAKEQQREAALERTNRMKQADLHALAGAATLRVEMKGITVVARPDEAVESVQRDRGYRAFKNVVALFSAALERARERAIREAAGLEPTPTRFDHQWLTKAVAEECRDAVRDGTVTVVTSDPDELGDHAEVEDQP